VFEISKPGGAYDKAAQEKAMKSGGGTTNIHVTFDPIMVKSEGNVGKIDLSADSQYMGMLGSAIKQAMNKAANGGVLSPNPA
jgi:hypothetical protein